MKKIWFVVAMVLGVVLGYAKVHGQESQLAREFKWGDLNHPIGILVTSEQTQATDKNPAGWNEVLNSGVTPPEAWPKPYLDRAIPVLKKIKAQRVVFWDLEGAKYGSRTGIPAESEMYVGAPDLAVKMNPGVDYDYIFKRLTSEGIGTGVCIRPEEFNLVTGKHEPSVDPYNTILRRATYANKRWGCDVFYIDSNTRTKLPDVPNQWVEGWVLPSTIIKRLNEAMPKVLWIPEHKDVAYHLWSAPYRGAGNGEFSTPFYIRRDIPDAISCINLNGVDIKAHAAELKAGNNLMMLNAWFQYQGIDDYVSVFISNN